MGRKWGHPSFIICTAVPAMFPYRSSLPQIRLQKRSFQSSVVALKTIPWMLLDVMLTQSFDGESIREIPEFRNIKTRMNKKSTRGKRKRSKEKEKNTRMNQRNIKETETRQKLGNREISLLFFFQFNFKIKRVC
jgi:hypothetical protein